MAYHIPTASARSEPPLMVLAQQLVHQQQQQLQHFQQQYNHSHPASAALHHVNSNVANPCEYAQWQDRSDEHLMLPSGIPLDVLDYGCPTSGGSYFTEPTAALNISNSELLSASVQSHFHDPHYLAQQHLSFDGEGLKVQDCESGENTFYDVFQREASITENGAGHVLKTQKNEMTTAIPTIEERGELEGFAPSSICIRLPQKNEMTTVIPTVERRGEIEGFAPSSMCIRLPNNLETSKPTGRNDTCVGDTTSEWMDCLMNDLQSDEAIEGVASCFAGNPCESTESSELPDGITAGRCYSCTPEDAWPDCFTALEEALGVRNGCSRDVSPSSWTQDTSNEFLSSSPSCDIFSSSFPVFIPSNSLVQKKTNFVRQGHLILHGMQYSEKMSGMPELTDAKSISEDRTRRDSGASAGKEGVIPRLKSKGEYKRQACQVSSAHGLQLLHLLLDCAKAIDSERERAEKDIAQIRSLSSKHGDPIQRLAAYITEALAKRLARESGTSNPPPCEEAFRSSELTVAYKVLNDASPYFKFAHLTANQAILDSMETTKKVHIVDFGISQGVQWAALLQAFATRSAATARPRIRMTGIGSSSLGEEDDEERKESLLATGRRLTEFAKLLELEFEFQAVVSKMDDVDISTFRIEEDESVAVNFMLELHNLLGESLHFLHRMLRVVRSLSPKVVTIAEYDASLNVGPFQKRFMNALHFYGAIFDSLDAAIPRDCADRQRMERLFFEEKIKNMLGCEGRERTKRLEGKEQWEAIMSSAGFCFIPLSHYAVSQARLLLWHYSHNYSLTQGHDDDAQPSSLSLCWQQRPLLTVSAWSLSSSSFPSLPPPN